MGGSCDKLLFGGSLKIMERRIGEKMKFEPKMQKYQHKFVTVDSHTMGEPTRIVMEGFPELPGDTMMEKKKFLEQHYDHYRKALMLEPRGHRDMFGALLTRPVHAEADLGVIFMDSGGYLNMCGHGSIGTATVAVETGLVPVTEPYTEVVLDAPSGIIRTRVKVEKGRAVEVSIRNVPAFLYKENVPVEMSGYGTIMVDISFGGSFFALVDAEKLGLEITMDNIEEITDLGMKLMKKINDTVEIRHPYLDITTVDLVEFYCSPTNPSADKKNVVIFGESQADRSPCGTGTSAKLATLYARGEIRLGQEFVYESITGSMFRGIATEEVALNEEIQAIIPQITGSAYVTGYNTWLLDEDDPLEMGFLFGKKKEAPPVSDQVKVVRAAWKLFRTKGYDETTVDDIVEKSGVSMESFRSMYEKKEDLVDTLPDLFDAKYAELLLELNPHLSQYEKLLFFNKELFRMIENDVPKKLLAHEYSASMTGNDGKNHLTRKDRLYFQLIQKIMETGQNSGEFSTNFTAREMADAYVLLERGMLYDWCVRDEDYSLTDYSSRMLPGYLKQFLK